MIRIIDKRGQLCNRMWAITPFIAQSLHNKTKIKILFFGQYYHLFENLDRFNNISFTAKPKRYSPWWYKILFMALSFFPQSFFSWINLYFPQYNNSDKYKEAFQSDKNIIFLSSWKYRKPNEYLKPNLTDIQKLFSPKKQHIEKVEHILNLKRERFDTIIGVHIRRGDYAQYQDGGYFYSDAVYIHYMNQLMNEMNSEKTGFLLCSDSSIDTGNFSSMQVFSIPKAENIEDLYALGLCDYIIGPPSTFSMWASFYGEKPIYFIKKSDGEVRLSDFSIVVAQNKFENGETLS